jgi:hypothetical protein
LEYLLFVVYLVVFAWLVTRTNFFKWTGLNRDQLVILFLVKVIAGIFYGWIGVYYGGYAQMVDTWSYHYQSIDELKLLTSNPHEYFTNFLPSPRSDEGLGEFLGSSNSYWNDLKSMIFIKLLSVFDIFSMGNYYVNVIFYSYLTLFGPIALYRVMKEVFPEEKMMLLIAIFLVPSFTYWSSGVHKEGLIFLGISLIVYHVYFALQEKKWKLKRWLGILLGIFLFLLLRNFLLILIAPAVIAWLLASRSPRYRLACFGIVYTIGAILFFCLRYVHPKLDFPQAVVDKQQAFLVLTGNTSIPIHELKPDAWSFLINTPQAITLSAFRPYPSDIHHLFSMAAAIEMLLLLLLFICFLIWHKKGVAKDKSVVLFCVFFAISLLLTIGFSVNNLGAIVRYRSIAMPLLIPVMVAYTDWKRMPIPLFSNIRKINNSIKY